MIRYGETGLAEAGRLWIGRQRTAGYGGVRQAKAVEDRCGTVGPGGARTAWKGLLGYGLAVKTRPGAARRDNARSGKAV